MPDSPYISFVVTSRNDNHGDALLRRMQTFVNCLMDQCRRHKLPAELVLVEWNPPPDLPSLAQALTWPTIGQSCTVRIIQVPLHLHRRFPNSDKLRLFQMTAKNVGIRRALAPYVLATNIDILFSEELMAYMASRRLNDRFMYRVDRHDVPGDLPTELPVQQLLEFCRKNVIRIYKRGGAMDAKTGQYDEGSVTWKTKVHDIYRTLIGETGEKRLHTNASGDFTLLSKAHWLSFRAYPELHTHAMNIDGLGCQIAYFSGAKERVLPSPMQVYHMQHSISGCAEGDGALSAASKRSGVPTLDYELYRELAIRMRKEKRPVVLNDDSWGLANEQLPEITISDSTVL